MTSRKPPAPTPAPPAPLAPHPQFADTLPPYDRFDPIPQPEVEEGSSETTWELWHDVHGKEHARYANTQPMTVPGERSPLSKNAPPPGAPLRPVASTGTSGLEKLVEETRRNNRVCPKAAKWAELDKALRGVAPSGSAAFLPPPLAEREWKSTTSLAKRLMFRGVIDWAGKNGLVEPALQFVRALPEDQWHHMGD